MTYERISGALGPLLLLWAAIERTARQEITRASGSLPKSAHGIAASLRTWETIIPAAPATAALRPLLARELLDQLRRPLAVRNGLCHGLIGIASGSEEGPATLTWELNGEEQSITWEELQASFAWLSKVPRAILMISSPCPVSTADRYIDSLENREWWLAEFGLDLP